MKNNTEHINTVWNKGQTFYINRRWLTEATVLDRAYAVHVHPSYPSSPDIEDELRNERHALPSGVRSRHQYCIHVGTPNRAPPQQLRKRGTR
jgi:hypothetical protein